LVIDYGFNYLPINKITARIFHPNQSSRGLADKLGIESHAGNDGEALASLIQNEKMGPL